MKGERRWSREGNGALTLEGTSVGTENPLEVSFILLLGSAKFEPDSFFPFHRSIKLGQDSCGSNLLHNV